MRVALISGSNWNLAFLWREENRRTRRKTLGAGKRTNKLNPHVKPGPGIEPGLQRWEANGLTTASSLHRPAPSLHPCIPLAPHLHPPTPSLHPPTPSLHPCISLAPSLHPCTPLLLRHPCIPLAPFLHPWNWILVSILSRLPQNTASSSYLRKKISLFPFKFYQDIFWSS